MTDTTEVRTVLVTDADVQLLDAALFVLRSADLLQERRGALNALRDRIAGRYVSDMDIIGRTDRIGHGTVSRQGTVSFNLRNDEARATFEAAVTAFAENRRILLSGNLPDFPPSAWYRVESVSRGGTETGTITITLVDAPVETLGQPLPPIASVSLSIDPKASAEASRRFLEAAYPRGEVL